MASLLSTDGSLRYAAGILLILGLGCSGDGATWPSRGVLARIVLTPGSVTLTPTGSQNFVASCLTASGVPIRCPELTWQALGGTRSSSGRIPDTEVTYTAGPTTGLFTLTVHAGSISQFAPITIIPNGPLSPNVVVDAGQTFQTMTGWEVTPFFPRQITGQNRANLYRLAVEDMGITRVRLEATGNLIETLEPSPNGDTGGPATNDDSDPNSVNAAGFQWAAFDQRVTETVLPLKQLVEARGERFFLNVCYVGFRSSTDFQQTNPAEYREFTLVVLERLRNTFGVVPNVWEARLEPDNGFVIDGTQMGQNIVAAGSAARAAGFTNLTFAAPSTLAAANAVPYLDAIRAVPGAALFVSEVTYHRYGVQPQPSTLTGILSAAVSVGAQTGMLEHIRGDHHELYEDLTQANVSSWQQFTLAMNGPTDNGGALYLVDPAGNFTPSFLAKFLRQYFRYIRPGDVRIGASTTLASGLEPVAFRAASGRTVLVANTSGLVTITVAGLPAGTYHPSYTTATQEDVRAAPITIVAGQYLTTSIPAEGVITIAL